MHLREEENCDHMGTAKNTQQLAQDLAKQIAREPLEILREAGKQIVGGEQAIKSQDIIQTPNIQNPESRPKNTHYQNELQDKAKSSRRMEALNQEIADIRKQDLFNDLQSRIAEGEDVSLEDYTELSMEQRQVLKAQEEAVKNRIDKEQNTGLNEVPAIHSKPSRRFGAGQRHEAEKQQTRIEKPIPPSG